MKLSPEPGKERNPYHKTAQEDEIFTQDVLFFFTGSSSPFKAHASYSVP
jgi:hypothetical protein